MNKIKIVQTISIITIVTGIVIVAGWYFDNTIVTSIFPGWVRMKIATAICFIFSGIIFYVLALNNSERTAIQQSMLIIFPTYIVLVMGSLFFGSIFGFQTGLENIELTDYHETNTPIFQGRPSVLTMIAFYLIAYIGFISSLSVRIKKTFYGISLVLIVIGLVAVVGYIINLPVLYYEIPGFSNAIAFSTAMLFALLGLATLKIYQQRKKE